MQRNEQKRAHLVLVQTLRDPRKVISIAVRERAEGLQVPELF